MGRRATIGGIDPAVPDAWRRRRPSPVPSRSTPSPCSDRATVTVPVVERFPLARAAEAYERFAAGGKLGKIVLVR